MQGTDVQIPQHGECRHSEEQLSNMALSRKSSTQGLSSCLSPAAKTVCIQKITNANLPPTTCIDNDAFSKVTIVVCSAN